MHPKDSLRAQFLLSRRQFVETYRDQLNDIQSRIFDQVDQILPRGQGPILAYRAKMPEVNLDKWLEPELERFAFPRVEGNDMSFYQPKHWSEFTIGSWEVLEPNPVTATKIDLGDCPAVIVPGVAFDRRGYRLGYGKAYFDRALANYRGLKVGVAYSVQVNSEDLETEDHDVPMDYVVTENFVLKLLKD